MGLFGFGKKTSEGGVMDVIRCDEQEYLVWKWRPAGQEANTTAKENAIRWGSSLRVKEGEMAIFVYKQDNGQLMDKIQGPYDGIIKTKDFPILTNIIGLAYGGDSPFQAEVYFVNLQANNQIKFGVPYFDVADPRFTDFTVPVAVRGTLTFNLTDVDQFIRLNRLINFDLVSFREQISAMIKRVTKNYVTNCPAEFNISVLQLERKIEDINNHLQERLATKLAEDFGINLKRLDISAVEIDKESEDYTQFLHATKEQQKIQAEQIGRRAQIETEVYEKSAKLGVESQHLQAHAIDKQAEVLSAAANNLGQMGGQIDTNGGGMNPVGMMMGMGMAAGMANQMAGMMGNGMNAINQAIQQPTAPQQTPPPVPGAVNYMLAINGQQYGPYAMSQLQQMAAAGQLTAETLVWCQGMAAWEPASTRQDLATLFNS